MWRLERQADRVCPTVASGVGVARMTFLQPSILWGLPLVLLPVLIHLFNRLRHRSVPWAAMMFLRTATRKSTRYARLRQFLILLLRMLAVAALIIAISRPLAGGWAGWLFSGAPDVILVLLDRSASMETTQAGLSRRAQALELIAQNAARFAEASELVLIESVHRRPQTIADPSVLPELSLTAPTDTAADLPALVQSALDWLTENQPGSAELWIASDLQRSNWRSDSSQWPALAEALAALPQQVRVRLLAMNLEAGNDASIAVREVNRRWTREGSELELTLAIERDSAAQATLPLTVSLNGARTQTPLTVQGQSVRTRQRLPVPAETLEGWGYLELPADANARNNRSYFVFGLPPVYRALVVSTNRLAGTLLKVATAPNPADTNHVCEWTTPEAWDASDLEELSLVIWHAPLPEGQLGQRLLAFVESGGVLLCFPPETPGTLAGLSWGKVEVAPEDKPFAVGHWEKQEGPLARTSEGLDLPLNELSVRRRQIISGGVNLLAVFEDEAPLLARTSVGRGQVVFCGTLPLPEWSNLDEGSVLVPMLRRLLERGGQRLSAARSLACGQVLPAPSEPWEPVEGSAGADFATQAGVYRSGNRLLAVNRPEAEEDRTHLEAEQARALFGTLPVQLFEEKPTRQNRLQVELWRLFLIAMALLLLGEAILILPEKPAEGVVPLPGSPKRPEDEPLAEAV